MNIRLMPILIISFTFLIGVKLLELSFNKDTSKLMNVFSSKIAEAATESVPVNNTPKEEKRNKDEPVKQIEKRWQHYDNVVNARNRNVSLTKPETMFDKHICSDVNLDLLETLSKRKQIIDKWQNDAVNKQNILMAITAQLDEKLIELKKTKLELADLVGQYDDAKKAKIANLVKIYESMKPQDAARIFSTLELDILIKVMDNMKQAKIGSIMANLPPEKARDITMAYASLGNAEKIK